MASSTRSSIAVSKSLGRFVASTRTKSRDWSPVRNKRAFKALRWASLMLTLLRLHQTTENEEDEEARLGGPEAKSKESKL